MKFTGEIVGISKYGKLRIPKKTLKSLSFIDNKNPQVEIYLSSDYIVIQPYKPTCAVTGKSSEELVEILPNFYISKEGMELLLEELEKKYNI